MPLSEDDIREILRLIDESDVEELRVETDSLSLYVLRGDAAAAGPPEAPRTTARAGAAPTPPASPTGDLVTIAAPMIGTFYRAEAPGAEPFVAPGTHVQPGTTVCLIEVMKMMNPIPAGVTGTIVEVCAENAQPVEYGAPLFQVEADG
jgi:acetyl-CoA carboxylase biotin carboxyl carrier protein